MICKQCNSTKKINGTGGMEKRCDACTCAYFKIRYWFKENKHRLTGLQCIKNFPIQLALAGVVFCLLLAIHFDSISATLTLSIGSLTLIFAALKYKLDQANYHKDLFEKRYEIFLEINNIQYDFTQLEDITKIGDMQNLRVRCDKQMQRAYYLFDEITFKFIEDFRQALINIESLAKSPEDTAKEKISNAKAFLGDLTDYKKMLDSFPDLKINSY